MPRTIQYFILTLTFFFSHFILVAQQNKIDSLQQVLKTAKEDTNRINTLNLLGRELFLAANYEKATNYSNSAKQLAEKLNYKKGIAVAYNNMGNINMSEGDYPNALSNHFASLKIREETKDEKGICSSIGNIGVIYDYQGDYPKALDYYFKALKMAEKLGNKNGVANNISNIGVIYQHLSDYPKALEYFFKGLKIDEELGDKNGIATDFGNIGIAYKNQKDNPKALDFYFKALKMAEELGDKNGIARHFGCIGNVYYNQKDYPKALDYLFKALRMDEELGNKNSIANGLGNIGSVYMSIKQYKEAEEYFQQALTLSTEINSLDIIESNEEMLSQFYEQTNQPAKALEHYKKHIAARDSIFNKENTKKTVRSEMNFEFDKKHAIEKAEQDKKDALAAEELKQQKQQRNYFIIGFALVLLLALFIFRSYRQKQKANTIITQQKEEVEKQKEIIEEKNNDITDSINYASRIQRAILPHRREIWAAFQDSFVLYKPKDIVSGDFYFFHKTLSPSSEFISMKEGDSTGQSLLFIAAGDCTGHGVPGALMSMIGAEKLKEAVLQTTLTSEILSHLNKGIKLSLRQNEGEVSSRDGMDIAICSVDTKNRIVKYAGANRPLWIIRNGIKEVEEIKATKTAIGGFTADSQHFDTHEIQLNKGDRFYLHTDGYADTFGGQGRKKLMTKRFKEILLSIQHKTMREQGQHLENFIEEWKAGTEQVDDILVIGVQL